jgi:hypothetical protein
MAFWSHQTGDAAFTPATATPQDPQDSRANNDSNKTRPAGVFGGNTLLRLAAQKSTPTARAISAYAQYAFLLSLRMRSINLTKLDTTRSTRE